MKRVICKDCGATIDLVKEGIGRADRETLDLCARCDRHLWLEGLSMKDLLRAIRENERRKLA